MPGDGRNPESWSSEDTFAAVLETAAVNEAELAAYCRRKEQALAETAALPVLGKKMYAIRGEGEDE